MKNYTRANIINIMWQGEKRRERGSIPTVATIQ